MRTGLVRTVGVNGSLMIHRSVHVDANVNEDGSGGYVWAISVVGKKPPDRTVWIVKPASSRPVISPAARRCIAERSRN